ncbi:MAG: glycosyltransferase [Anaerolineales bacterium]
MTAWPPISVVVCTRDRAQLLRACLAALARLDYPAYEVIVVDNASRDDSTARAVAATPFRYVREEHPGLDWARNRGAAEARYDIVAYVDDDAQADPGWLGGLAGAFAGPNVAAATGLVLPLELETRAQQLFEEYSGMGKGAQPRLFQRDSMRPRELAAAHRVGVGANMAFRRNVFDTIGTFDTALDVGTPSGGGGDLDMFHRILVAGLAIRYEPAAVVRHQHRRDMPGLRHQLYNNGRSFGVYLIKVWRSRSLDRRVVARYALGWFGGWVLARFIKGLLWLERFPLPLLWAELWGACSAPWAYTATYHRNLRPRPVRSTELTSSF